MSIVDRDNQIQLKVGDIVKEAGAELLEFKAHSSSGKNILRCVVDFPQGGITLGSCAAINKRVVAYLDEGGNSGSDYTVEVNSPGLDRKLHTPGDFLKVKGKSISLWLQRPVEDKEYLEGQILAVGDEELSLGYKDKVLKINFNEIKFGKERIEIK